MINDAPNKFMVEQVSELPNFFNAEIIYLDFETTSGDDKKNSKHPWFTCDVLGICITVDECPDAYYVPLRHRHGDKNLPVEPVYNWLRKVVRTAKVWVNSNVKYDAHVYLNYVAEKGEDLTHLQMRDTVTLAKIIDSDRFTYGLKELSREWLEEDISVFEKANKVYTHNPGGSIKYHDYAVIPPYEMYMYGCQDSLSVRSLYKCIIKAMPPECTETAEVENQLTGVLAEIEQIGMRVDKPLLGNDALKRIPDILTTLEEELHKLTGKYFRPHVNSDCHEIICTLYGAPILNWTKGSKTKDPDPSFDKDTLKIYETYPQIPEGIISKIAEYRHYHQLLGTFTKPYIFKSVKRRVHGSFNQSVRTGRMSMSEPNMQQVSPDAKEYIIPEPGYILAESDLSQIEYRYVGTYTENPTILEEYRTNPNADFHQLMADLCGIDRKPAKNMNFASSFRAGKKKTISMLRAAFNPDEVPDNWDFGAYCEQRGEHIYNTYHERFPELRQEWAEAQRKCKKRGYCRNVWGRRRHLTNKGSYMAFPNIIQSSAADLMKRITIRLQNLLRNEEPRLICIVHDSWLFEIPEGQNEKWQPIIKDCIESTEARLKVPLYASYGTSDKNWRLCES